MHVASQTRTHTPIPDTDTLPPDKGILDVLPYLFFYSASKKSQVVFYRPCTSLTGCKKKRFKKGACGQLMRNATLPLPPETNTMMDT